MTNHSTAKHDYRIRAYFFVVGIVTLVLFSTMGISSAAAAYWNVDGSFPRPLEMAITFGAFWTAIVLSSIWLIVVSCRYYLILSETTIAQREIISSTAIEMADVTQIQWRRVPRGGGVVIRTVTKKLTICFDLFIRSDRAEIIAFLHNAFDADIQEGWPQFSEVFLHPKPPDRRKELIAGALWTLYIFFPGSFFCYCWTAGWGTRWLVIGVSLILLGLSYLWRIFKAARQLALNQAYVSGRFWTVG